MNQRTEYLDSIAGLLIIIMLGTHLGVIPGGPRTIGPLFSFYMAWFFFKSGMFHRFDRKLTKEVVMKWVKGIIVPYILFSLFGLMFDIIHGYIVNKSIGIILYSFCAQMCTMGFAWCNAPLWFLLALFLTRIITTMIPQKYWILFGLLFLGIAIIHHMIWTERFQYLGNTSLAIVYYICGYKMRELHKNKLIVVLSSLIYLGVFLLFPVCLDLRSNSTSYGNYLLSLLIVIPGILCINSIFDKSSLPGSRIFAIIGQNAMALIVLHWPIMQILNKSSIDLYNYFELNGYRLNWVIAIITLSVCSICCYLINRYSRFKWIIGG